MKYQLKCFCKADKTVFCNNCKKYHLIKEDFIMGKDFILCKNCSCVSYTRTWTAIEFNRRLKLIPDTNKPKWMMDM